MRVAAQLRSQAHSDPATRADAGRAMALLTCSDDDAFAQQAAHQHELLIRVEAGQFGRA